MNVLFQIIKKVFAHPAARKWAVTALILYALYYVTFDVIIPVVTQPPLEMMTSPLAGGIAVAVEPAGFDEITRTVTYTGSITPIHEVTVFPRYEGWVLDFGLYEGDYVKKGQVIARLDKTELQATVEATEGELGAAENELAMAKADLAFWEAEFPRIRELYENNAVSATDHDNARARHEAAQAGVAAAESQMAALKAKLERQKTVLGYTDIEALASGRVSKRYIYSGIFVRPGMPIVDIQDLSRARVQAKVSEKDLPYLRPGGPVVARFPSLPNPHSEFRSRVSTIFPQLDPVSRTATVETILNNPKEIIKTDMYTVVDFVLEHKPRALVVPRTAIVMVEGQPTVFVAEGNIAVARAVKTGIAEQDRIEILEGVNENELVIYEGNRGLVDGQPITVVKGLGF